MKSAFDITWEEDWLKEEIQFNSILFQFSTEHKWTRYVNKMTI